MSHSRGPPLFPVCFAAVAAALLLTACDASGPAVLGVAAGENFLAAVHLAVEEERSESALPGFDTVMIVSGMSRSAPAIEAADSLVSVPGMVAVVGHSNSAASLAASQIYNDHGVVQLAPTSTAASYSEAGPYSFRMVPPDDGQGAFIADFLARTFPDGARVAVFYVNDDYGRGLRRAFVEDVDSTRFPVAVDLPHVEAEVDEADVRHAEDALGAAEPDVVLWLGRPWVLGRHLPGIRRTLGEVPVIGGDAVASAVQLPNESGLWNGVRYVDFLDLDGTEALRRFRHRFRERFGVQAMGPEVLTYDAVRLLMVGIRAGARSGEEMREYLVSLGRERPPFQGLSGPVTFDAEGDVERGYVIDTIGPEKER